VRLAQNIRRVVKDFNGHLPVFVHEKNVLATFRLFSAQLVINCNATQAQISRAFGVPLVIGKRYMKP
jgi:hypothetical protein